MNHRKLFVQNTPHDGFNDRLKTAAAARQALLSNFKPRPARPALEPFSRTADRALALAKVRMDRAEAKAVKQAIAAAQLAAEAQAKADLEASELSAKRSSRKNRKALSATEAKAKRDARYAARKSRR